ncbi:MAG: hypothetical protein QW625_00850 [Candidatus Nanoarchaeia archaeon]
MKKEVVDDAIKVLREAINAIKTERHIELHSISNHILHAIALYQEPDLMDLAVAIYSIDKILEDEKFKTHPKMPLFKKVVSTSLENAIELLENEKFNAYEASIRALLSNIEGFSKAIRFYIEDVIHFARIKKGTRLYEHGLTLGKAAELARVTKWELLPSIGETATHEKMPQEIPVTYRLKELERLFGGKHG